jgi:glycosyltransferase involved in cell wall biosynthesis
VSIHSSRTPDVTVVIPTKDRPQLLPTTLASVLAQRDVAIEVVIVDDGSDPPLAAAQLAILEDERVTLVRHERPGGVAAARNAGIERAQADWVATLDDDDLWHPDKLRRQLAAAREAHAVWSFCGAVHFLPGPRAWFVHRPAHLDMVRRRLPHENLVPAGSSNVLVRRDTYEQIGGFDTDLVHLADWNAWCALLRVGPPAIVDETMVAYRLHGSNMVLGSRDGLLAEVDVIEARTRDLRAGKPLDRRAIHRWVATMLMRTGQRAEARREYLAAARCGDRAAWLRVIRSFVPATELRRRRHAAEVPAAVAAWLNEVANGAT